MHRRQSAQSQDPCRGQRRELAGPGGPLGGLSFSCLTLQAAAGGWRRARTVSVSRVHSETEALELRLHTQGRQAGRGSRRRGRGARDDAQMRNDKLQQRPLHNSSAEREEGADGEITGRQVTGRAGDVPAHDPMPWASPSPPAADSTPRRSLGSPPPTAPRLRAHM